MRPVFRSSEPPTLQSHLGQEQPSTVTLTTILHSGWACVASRPTFFLTDAVHALVLKWHSVKMYLGYKTTMIIWTNETFSNKQFVNWLHISVTKESTTNTHWLVWSSNTFFQSCSQPRPSSKERRELERVWVESSVNVLSLLSETHICFSWQPWKVNNFPPTMKGCKPIRPSCLV